MPSCQPLYKNSFTYHTVSTSPPDFQECFEFLGESASYSLLTDLLLECFCLVYVPGIH